MGCVSSKILAKSGSFQEKVSSLGHSFQRSSGIEDIILSTSNSKNNGDQFLALLRTSTSSARKAKEPEVVAAAGEPAAKIETIDVLELLAGLEEEGCCTAERGRERRQSSRDEGEAPWSASAGRARSFRTVEEFDAMLLTQQKQTQTQTQSESGSSSEGPTALATEKGEELATGATASAAATAGAEQAGGPEAASGAKRRARARQLGELNLPTVAAAFDFSKSGSLRDWLRQGGQIFSPGSYVTPRFGTAPVSPPSERGEAGGGGEQQQQHQQALFDPELVAQFERAMEQLSEDEGRVLDEILEALELEAAEKDGAAAVVGGVGHEQPAGVAADALGQQV